MWAKFAISLFFLPSLLFAATSSPSPYKPYLVTVVLNEVKQEGFYHCYCDSEGNLWMPDEELHRLGFPQSSLSPKPYQNKNLLLLNHFEKLQTQLDTNNLTLAVNTPFNWEAGTVISQTTLLNGKIRPSQPGFFLNYDVTGRQVEFSNQNYGASLGEIGYFNHYGVGTSSFLFNGYNYYTSQYNMARLDTRWTLDQPEKMASWRYGDSVSSGLLWSGAVRFAGIQYATNFNTQPALVTFPQPQYRGEAAVPSVVDVYVNDTLNSQQSVNRGPFFLNQIPVVTGSGNLQIVTTDLLGRQQLVSLPYYASPLLLKPGLENFSYEAGVIRNNYGINNYDYGRGMAIGTYSLGITDRYTTGFHGELLKEQQTLGFNNNYLWRDWGTISLGAALSNSEENLGGLLSIGFNRSASFLSYGAQATTATSDYTQIGTLNSNNYPSYTLQSFVGVAVPEIGSFAVSYTALNNAYNEEKNIAYNYLFPDTRLVSLNYNTVLFQKFFLNVGAFKDLKNHNNDQVFITISLPFDGDKLISANNQSQWNNHQNNLQLSKNLPFGEGYGYHIMSTDNKNYPAQADVTLQKDFGVFTGRYANLNRENNFELNARGSLVHFANHSFPARYVEQSFALVETPGFENVAVYSRNQLVGKTNAKGYLYIPETLPYQMNEIAIDTRSLPFNVNITDTNKVVVPYWKSGALVTFDMQKTMPVLLTLKQDTEDVVPAGAEVFLDNTMQEPIPVGYNGQIFINTACGNSISGHAKWENHSCSFHYNLPVSSEKLIKDSVICSTDLR